MSVQASEAFLKVLNGTPSVAQQLKAVTGIEEVVRLGHRHGFDFTANDFREASTFYRPAAQAPKRPSRHRRSRGTPPSSTTSTAWRTSPASRPSSTSCPA